MQLINTLKQRLLYITSKELKQGAVSNDQTGTLSDLSQLDLGYTELCGPHDSCLRR